MNDDKNTKNGRRKRATSNALKPYSAPKITKQKWSATSTTINADLLPDDIFKEIFKRSDYTTLRTLKQVCRRFQVLLSDIPLWVDICETSGCILPPTSFRRSLLEKRAEIEETYGQSPQIDYEMICSKNPFSMQVEELKGEEPITRCIATSYIWGDRRVVIDLINEGVSEWILDHIRPRIVVSEWVRPRDDCAAVYMIRAQLLKDNESFLDNEFEFAQRDKIAIRSWPQWTKLGFEKVELVFEDYPISVRKIEIQSVGKDQQSWAGFYGAKFANLGVRIEMPNEVRWLTEDVFPDPSTE